MMVVKTANVIDVTNQPGYLEKLEALQQRCARVRDRIHFILEIQYLFMKFFSGCLYVKNL